jgi:hypothetical protein
LSIDGSTGEVFDGDLAGNRQIAPEAATLLAWARELGIQIPAEQQEDGTRPQAAQRPIGPATSGDVLHALLIKGSLPADQLAAAVGAEHTMVSSLTEELVRQGLAETAQGACRLTGVGKLRALAAVGSDRARFGADRAEALLSAFQPLDQRMKAIVTAWQMRAIGSEPQLNDHSDPAYDASVLGLLADLHADMITWISPAAASIPRFGLYQARLDRALRAARDGDQRYVASPRVDSYHSVWFELHEDVIRLAGHQRADAG